MLEKKMHQNYFINTISSISPLILFANPLTFLISKFFYSPNILFHLLLSSNFGHMYPILLRILQMSLNSLYDLAHYLVTSPLPLLLSQFQPYSCPYLKKTWDSPAWWSLHTGNSYLLQVSRQISPPQ